MLLPQKCSLLSQNQIALIRQNCKKIFIFLDHHQLINTTIYPLSERREVHLLDMVIKQISGKTVDLLLLQVLIKFKAVLGRIKNMEPRWVYQDK